MENLSMKTLNRQTVLFETPLVVIQCLVCHDKHSKKIPEAHFPWPLQFQSLSWWNQNIFRSNTSYYCDQLQICRWCQWMKTSTRYMHCSFKLWLFVQIQKGPYSSKSGKQQRPIYCFQKNTSCFLIFSKGSLREDQYLKRWALQLAKSKSQILLLAVGFHRLLPSSSEKIFYP